MLSKPLTMLRTALVCTIPLLAAGSQAQTTINVGPGQAYTTIQSGINAAVNGDTVLVVPGTYHENIDFKGKAITVTSSGGAASTIIDGGAAEGSAVVTFKTGELRSSVISNFTIRNGGVSTVGSEAAGGVYVSNSAPSILNNIITGNSCYGVSVNFGDALIESNEISSTSAPNSGYCTETGAAVFLGGDTTVGGYSSSSIIGNTIENNNDGSDSGGIVFYAVEGSYVQGNIIRNNTGQQGGALWSVNSDNMYILQNLIYGNSATSSYLANAGGLSILPPGDTVGAFIGVIAGNTITGNSISGSYAAGELATDVAIEGNLGQYVFVNNIISGSSSTVPALVCGEIYSYLTLTPLVFDHNDIYNSNGPAYGGACKDQTGAYGNISADAHFAGPSSGNYQLSAGSPAIDSGNNSAPLMLSIDIARNPRIQDATGKDYPVVDMGAYEFNGKQDASPTFLTLTPNEYFYPPGYTLFNPTAPLTFTSTLTSAAGTPSGPVTVFVDDVQFAVEQIGSSGTATYNLVGLTPGLHAFTSTYPGSGVFPPAVSVKFYLIIPVTATTLTLKSSSNPSILSSPVTFTVTASAADGTIPAPVTLTDTSTNTLLATLTPNSSGVATYTTSNLSLGYHYLKAAYAGTSTYAAATAYLNQDVINGSLTTTTLSCLANPIYIYGTALFTANLTSTGGTPTGSIAFTDNGTALGQPSLLNGTASLNYTGQVVGTHTIVATYVPTGAFAASSATCSEVINALPTTSVLTVSPILSSYGSPVNLMAAVSPTTPPGAGTPAGTVTFYSGATALNAPVNLAGGVASLTVSNLSGGTDNLTCTYNGSSIYATSQCNTVPVTISAAASTLTLTSSLNPAPALTTVTFTAHLTYSGQPAPAGDTITLGFNGQTITLTTDATGSATYSVSTLIPGSYPVTANFAGTSSLVASSASLTEVITAVPTVTALTVSPNPAYLSQLVTMTANVTASGGTVNSGSVTFLDGTTTLATQMVTSGVAMFTISTLAVGTHPITATYNPTSPDYVTSTSSIVNEVILPSGFLIALSPTTLTLAPGATGTDGILLTSVGNFAGPLALTYGTLPTYATASISPTTVTLTAGGTGTSTLTLKTLLKAANTVPKRPGSRELPLIVTAFLLLLAPFGVGRRRMFQRVLGAVVMLAAMQAISGCTNAWYTGEVVASGTYQVPVTATDIHGNAQTATLTVIVTP